MIEHELTSAELEYAKRVVKRLERRSRGWVRVRWVLVAWFLACLAGVVWQALDLLQPGRPGDVFLFGEDSPASVDTVLGMSARQARLIRHYAWSVVAVTVVFCLDVLGLSYVLVNWQFGIRCGLLAKLLGSLLAGCAHSEQAVRDPSRSGLDSSSSARDQAGGSR